MSTSWFLDGSFGKDSLAGSFMLLVEFNYCGDWTEIPVFLVAVSWVLPLDAKSLLSSPGIPSPPLPFSQLLLFPSPAFPSPLLPPPTPLPTPSLSLPFSLSIFSKLFSCFCTGAPASQSQQHCIESFSHFDFLHLHLLVQKNSLLWRVYEIRMGLPRKPLIISLNHICSPICHVT